MGLEIRVSFSKDLFGQVSILKDKAVFLVDRKAI
jgi:hypothetical protein